MQIVKVITALLFVIFTLSCSNDPSTPTTQSGMITIPEAGDNHVKPTLVDHNILAPLIADWEVQAIIKVKDSNLRENLDGAWFNLALDQTFTFGQFESQTGQGTYNYDDATQIIEFFFNPSNVKIPTQYKLNGIGAYDGSTLIWMGNTPKNPIGMQLKMTKKIK